MERFGKKVIQEVPMVESQQANQIKRRINIPVAILNKSPAREAQNKSIISNRPLTPSRKPLGSVSPNRIRPEKSLKASNFPRPSASKELMCTNHQTKPAQFLVSTEDQQLPYCQKCSILLASQGFKLIKLNGSEQESSGMDILEEGPRKRQVEGFLDKLQAMSSKLDFLKAQVANKLTRSRKGYQEKVQEINGYYQYLLQAMQKHRMQTVELLTQHVEETQTQTKSALQMINQCVKDSKVMKEDIISSLQIIKDAREDDFRPVINSYYDRIRNFEECIEQVKHCRVPSTLLAFNDVVEVSKQATDLIQIGFQEKLGNHDSGRSSNPYFSFQGEQSAEEFRGKGSSIQPNTKPSTAAQEKTLRGSNLNKQRLGYSINQL